MDQKKKLIIGGAVAVSVVVAVVILFICLLSKPNILVADEPKFDIKDLNNMTPDDGSVLVAFQGFAKYLPTKYGNKRYLSLAPVTGIQVVDGKAFRDVKFDSVHGSVSLGVSFDHIKFDIWNITIATKDGDKEKACRIRNGSISFNRQAHYECMRPLPPLECVRTFKDKNGIWINVKEAELTISAIRFEINGNPNDHRRGRFTNHPEFCAVR